MNIISENYKAMDCSDKSNKRKNDGPSSSTSPNKIQRSDTASVSTEPSPPTMNLLDLPLDMTTRIISYLLDSDYTNIPSHSNSIVRILSLSNSCPRLCSAVDLHLEQYARSITSQRWHRLPYNFVQYVFGDALRKQIDGITKKTAMALMVPDAVLHSPGGSLCFKIHRFRGTYKTAHVFSVPDIFSYLSSVYPTVEVYEEAWKSKNQASNKAWMKRQENKRIREGREVEIQNIMREFHAVEEYKHDENLRNLAKKYVSNGSKKTLANIKDDARVVGLPNARRAEVEELIQVNGVDTRTVKYVDKEEYSKTGGVAILESIKASIQGEKDRLGSLDGYRKVFHQILLDLTDGAEWILQVPDYVWRRNTAIQEFLEHGSGDVTDACSDIVSVLRSKQGNSETEDSSASVQEYLTELRREDLVNELQKYKLTYRSEGAFCQEFIHATTDACVQEVVATTALSAHLNRDEFRCWEHNNFRLQSIMRSRYCSGEYSNWYDAMESVKSLVDYSYYDDDSDCDLDYFANRYNYDQSELNWLPGDY